MGCLRGETTEWHGTPWRCTHPLDPSQRLCQSHSLPHFHSALPVEQRTDTALLNSALASGVCAFTERCLHVSSRCLHTSSPPPNLSIGVSRLAPSLTFSACLIPKRCLLSAHFLNAVCIQPPCVCAHPFRTDTASSLTQLTNTAH